MCCCSASIHVTYTQPKILFHFRNTYTDTVSSHYQHQQKVEYVKRRLRTVFLLFSYIHNEFDNFKENEEQEKKTNFFFFILRARDSPPNRTFITRKKRKKLEFNSSKKISVCFEWRNLLICVVGSHINVYIFSFNSFGLFDRSTDTQG